ncbi:hypothetical protein DPMN_174037 [Dreissena polymorpha]|uniref:Uncharacterized protein n=1 Tax=Dreissena polymorpha TaxID=45954 RepID=A0A9D4E5P9_DREPO|nr:hypothetical protein DPMN_174037 [Dreissena polymorpha]
MNLTVVYNTLEQQKHTSHLHSRTSDGTKIMFCEGGVFKSWKFYEFRDFPCQNVADLCTDMAIRCLSQASTITDGELQAAAGHVPQVGTYCQGDRNWQATHCTPDQLFITQITHTKNTGSCKTKTFI